MYHCQKIICNILRMLFTTVNTSKEMERERNPPDSLRKSLDFVRHQVKTLYKQIRLSLLVNPTYGTASFQRAFRRCFCPDSSIDAVGCHAKCSLGFSVLPNGTSTCRLGESNPQPSDDKMLVLPLIHSCPKLELKHSSQQWSEIHQTSLENSRFCVSLN